MTRNFRESHVWVRGYSDGLRDVTDYPALLFADDFREHYEAGNAVGLALRCPCEVAA